MSVSDEVVEILFKEIVELRSAGYHMAGALQHGNEKARALALAAWEQTRRGVGK